MKLHELMIYIIFLITYACSYTWIKIGGGFRHRINVFMILIMYFLNILLIHKYSVKG